MLFQSLLLFGSAFAAGAMNSVAGGGSFFSFPALLFVGLDPKLANATNTVALWPGSVAGLGAFRREFQAQRENARLLSGVSLIGGLLGALLLLVTPSAIFRVLLPYLMLGATLIFALSPRINGWARRREAKAPPADGKNNRWRSIILQGLISIYGGFFGGGIGILMLATLALMGLEDIHEMNALKTLLAALINGIAVVAFVIAGSVAWPQAILMAVAAIIGGYSGAALSRRFQQRQVRNFVLGVGFLLSGYLFLK